jgi:uncharacterized membrane protein
MKTTLIAYFVTLVPMLVADGIWLTTMGKRFYGVQLGHLMGPALKWGPVAVFYPLYAVGVAVLVVLPAVQAKTPLLKVFLLGSLLGLIAYAAYDLTNQATLRDWPFVVTVVDMAWGALLTGVVGVVAVYLTRLWA